MPKREIKCQHKRPISECLECYPVFLKETTVGQALDDLEPSEFDRQMAIFNKKMDKPDRVIKAHSMVRHEPDDGSGDMIYFLSNDDTVTLVDMRDEEAQLNA